MMETEQKRSARTGDATASCAWQMDEDGVVDGQRAALNLYEGDAYYVEQRDSLHGEIFAVVRRSSGETAAIYDLPWEASDAARKMERESNQTSLF